MPVGFMLFKGLHLHLREVTALLEAHPETPAVVDHWGFFHQDGRDVEEAWAQLLALAKFPQVRAGALDDRPGQTQTDRQTPTPLQTHAPYTKKQTQLSIKVSAFFRVSSAAWPFADLAPRLEQLKAAYGADRLMWGRCVRMRRVHAMCGWTRSCPPSPDQPNHHHIIDAYAATSPMSPRWAAGTWRRLGRSWHGRSRACSRRSRTRTMPTSSAARSCGFLATSSGVEEKMARQWGSMCGAGTAFLQIKKESFCKGE